jgi:hypothetical protein
VVRKRPTSSIGGGAAKTDQVRKINHMGDSSECNIPDEDTCKNGRYISSVWPGPIARGASPPLRESATKNGESCALSLEHPIGDLKATHRGTLHARDVDSIAHPVTSKEEILESNATWWTEAQSTWFGESEAVVVGGVARDDCPMGLDTRDPVKTSSLGLG